MRRLPLLLLLTAPLFLAGCSYGELEFYGRWVGLIVLTLALIGGVLNGFDDDTDTGCGCLVIGLIIVSPIAYLLFPGFDRPGNYETTAQVTDQDTLKAKPKPPEKINIRKQLAQTQGTRDELKTYLQGKIPPLLQSYRAELNQFNAQLQVKIPASGVTSHEDLLREKDEHLELYLLLQKAATLQHSIDWLAAKQKRGERNLMELDHQVWRLEKLTELNEVASSEEDQVAIAELLMTAREVLESQLTVPQKQDLARVEADLFIRYSSR